MNDAIITPEEFAQRMADIFDYKKHDPYYDQESSHYEADNLMTELLRSLGYEKGCDIFDNESKWYA